VEEKKRSIANLIAFLDQRQVTPNSEINSQLEFFESAPLRNQATLSQILRRPEISLAQLRSLSSEIPSYSPDVDAQAEIQIKYAGYVAARWISSSVSKRWSMSDCPMTSTILKLAAYHARFAKS
jgi:tRNA uridine 5-carboxymethylaminomethyl modification enzyme